jgi:ATP-dependent Clp endopeptidase proteolytic subunit ClpP
MAADKTGEIYLYDEIGFGAITARGFADELKSLGRVDRINVRINSPGGDVFDGIAIHNLLKNHPANIVVSVDGWAASIASVIAMAGDSIEMASNAQIMIHDPYVGRVSGGAADMRKMAERLETTKQTLVDTYHERTLIPKEEISAMMGRETWLKAAEAKQFGFADHIVNDSGVSACASGDWIAKAPAFPSDGGRMSIYRAKLADMQRCTQAYAKA